MNKVKVHYLSNNEDKLKGNEKNKDNDDWGRTDLCKRVAGPGK